MRFETLVQVDEIMNTIVPQVMVPIGSLSSSRNGVCDTADSGQLES
jgi:hypothetical protein